MLPYLEITFTESHCHVGLCLIKPNTVWKLFGLDVPNVISAQVDGRKLTLGTSSRYERVKVSICSFYTDFINRLSLNEHDLVSYYYLEHYPFQ